MFNENAKLKEQYKKEISELHLEIRNAIDDYLRIISEKDKEIFELKENKRNGTYHK